MQVKAEIATEMNQNKEAVINLSIALCRLRQNLKEDVRKEDVNKDNDGYKKNNKIADKNEGK